MAKLDRGARAKEGSPGRRKALLVGAALIAILVLGLLLGSPRSGGPGPASAAERGGRGAALPAPAPRQDLSAGQAMARRPQRETPPAPPGLPAAVPTSGANDVPQLPTAPTYPPDTFALAEELHPGTTEPTDAPGSKDGKWRLRFLPTPYVVRAPAPIVVTLELLDPQGKRHDLSRAELSLRTANPRRENPPVYQADFVADGAGAYLARFLPPDDARAGLFGHVLFQIQAQLPDGSIQLLAGSIEYSPAPKARITGQFDDALKDGSLLIGMAVRADAPGLYRVTGQLFGPNLEPLAESYALQRLSEGDTRVALRFFGKTLVDKGVDGPYHLRQLYLSEEIVEEAYSAMGPLLEDAWTTRPYKVSQFSAEPYQPPLPTGPRIGPDDPSQQGKPPPIMKRPEHPAQAGPPRDGMGGPIPGAGGGPK